MASTGKSRRPPPPRDPRIESVPPAAPAVADPRSKMTVPEMRAVSISRARLESPPHMAGRISAGFERLKAARTADADDVAAMLVRIADSDRARQAAERKATALEAWTMDLEAKVAEARTRGDEIEQAMLAGKKELDVASKELERLRARVSALEGKLSSARREYEDAQTVERMKRDLEIDGLKDQHRRALANAGGGGAKKGVDGAVGRAAALLDELEKHEEDAAKSRARIVDGVRRALATERATDPPPTPIDRRAPTVAMPKASVPKRKTRRSIPAPGLEAGGLRDDPDAPGSS
jgi:chromosome segregation ATPase